MHIPILIALHIVIYFVKRCILQVQFVGLIVSSCWLLSLLTIFILQGCYSSILITDGKLHMQLLFTANKIPKGQRDLNYRFLLRAADSRLQFFFVQTCLAPPSLSLSFKSFLCTMTKQSLTLEVGWVPAGITKVVLRDWEQTYIRQRWWNSWIFKGYGFCLVFLKE